MILKLIFVFSSRTKIRVRTLINRFLTLSSPINLSKSSCTRLVQLSKQSKTPPVESVSILFSSRYPPSSLLISSKMSVALTLLSGSICSKPKRFVRDAIRVLTVSYWNLFFSYRFTTKTDFSRVFFSMGCLMFLTVLAVQPYFFNGGGWLF